MSIWSKVLIGMVFLGLLGLSHSAARMLKTHDAWRSKVVEHETEIKAVEAATRAVVQGDPDQGRPSIAQLETSLYQTTVDRGRVWFRATPGNVSQAGEERGKVTVTISQPDPHQVDDKEMVLYVLDEREYAAGGRYLGEFKVLSIAGQEVTMQPTIPPTDAELAAITTAASNPWSLYEVPLLDGHDVFAGMSDEQLRALLPPPPTKAAGESEGSFERRTKAHADFVEAYLRDGDKPLADDPPERIGVVVKFVKDDAAAIAALVTYNIPPGVLKTGLTYEYDTGTADGLIAAKVAEEVERKYRRPLWDFGVAFREFDRDEPILMDRIRAKEKELANMTAVLTDNKAQHLPFHQAEADRLKAEQDRLQREVAVVVARRDALIKELKQLNAAIAKTLSDNKQLAARLAELEQEAVRRAEDALAEAQVNAGN